MRNDTPPTDPLTALIALPAEWMQAMIGPMLTALPAAIPAMLAGAENETNQATHWADVAARLQAMWLDFQADEGQRLAATPITDMTPWLAQIESWQGQLARTTPQAPHKLWEEGLAIWRSALEQGIAPWRALLAPDTPVADATADTAPTNHTPAPPRTDRRFAASAWHDQPFFALLHQSYLTLAEQALASVAAIEGLEPARKAQLCFATKVLVDALSPDHFPLTNPLVIERAITTQGESLVKGMAHLINDLKRGQLTQTDPAAFKVGETIAITPGKVVHRERLFELIHYTPTTERVLAVPVVVFPPWINRFYILDLNPRKSFVRWALDQGLSVFMVSWKSADASMGDVTWDDYIAAEISAIEVVRARLGVPAVHALGYCVAGTTLAAALAILERRGDGKGVKSATFLTTQVDFEAAGDLKNFIDDQQIAVIEDLAPQGYLDGRYMAATFNLLRGNDLIWNYVVHNYLLGDDYKPFDLLFWNSETTNLPIKFHRAYLGDLYRDNRLVVPDSLSALGTPIDITRITTPCYIQAGREDHIAPAESVWRFTRHLPRAPWVFVLAGSGHIAGVVNPPAAGKYHHWTNPGPCDSLDGFVAGATEHPGSWWPHWRAWLAAQDSAEVPATAAKRTPGAPDDPVLGEAPGRYVIER